MIYSTATGASGKARVESADQTAQGSDIGEANARVTGTAQGAHQFIRVQYTADGAVIMYKQLRDLDTDEVQTNCIRRVSDGATIPFNPANRDYQEYLGGR